MLNIPEDIEKNKKKRDIWVHITSNHDFDESDIPVLKTLCYWYMVLDQCMDDISDDDGNVSVSYMNEIGDEKARPQLGSMKQASAEIRAINKQLGIKDEVAPKNNIAKGGFRLIRGKADAAKEKDRKSATSN
ncbi:MAG: hypothetical protein Q4E88_02800 [Coriobacteriia bacterium]|nr:hypothetical protein [Coriobacteriia bacterium]